MARRSAHVVRIKQGPQAEIAKVDARIDELSRRHDEIAAEIEALPLAKTFTDGDRLSAVQERIGQELVSLRDRRLALELQQMGLEPTEAAEGRKTPVSTALHYPPLPHDPIWPVSDDATDEERKAAELMNSFMGGIRTDAGNAMDGKVTVVSYTQQRHLSIDIALGLLRLWARAERERGDALEARLEALEASNEQVLSRGLFYAGTYQKALAYDRGSAVTHAGSLWVAITHAEQGETPGPSAAWQLAAKRGADGRDAPSLSGEAA